MIYHRHSASVYRGNNSVRRGYSGSRDYRRPSVLTKRHSPKPPPAPLDAEDRWKRIYLAFAAILLFGAVLTWRLYLLQTSQHREWLELAAKQQDTSLAIQQARAAIVDRAGVPLAVSVPRVSIGVHPRRIDNREEVTEVLAPLLGLSRVLVGQKLLSDRPFVWLARDLPTSVKEHLKALNADWLQIVAEYDRTYPQGKTAGALLGRISRDGKGLSGVELQFDQRLSNDRLQVPVHRDARGHLVAIGYQPQDEPNGQISLSIDMSVQHIMETELARGVQEAKARRGFAILMDADSGELLAMAQAPTFDPNSPHALPGDLRNDPIQDSFEPGSTLKPMVAAAAFLNGVIGANDLIDGQNGRFQFEGRTIRDVHGVGLIPFREALIRSSNICFAKVGLTLGKMRLHNFLQMLGFGAKTGIELPGEATGILRDARKWREMDVATHSFGHGIAVTGIQMVRAFSALMNGGWLVQPTILRNGARNQQARKQIIDEKISAQLYEQLIEVTRSEMGTGRQAALEYVPVAGKTGTAHKPDRLGGYSASKILASFIGFIDGKPLGVGHRLTMLVVIDEPEVTPRWGGVLAAPVFRRIMEQTIPRLMATPDRALTRAEGEVAAFYDRETTSSASL